VKRFALTILSVGLGVAAAILPSGLPCNAPPVTAGLMSSQIDIAGPAGSEGFGQTVLALPNGNIVVTNPLYDSGGTADVGAVYLYNGATQALISTLTGSKANDTVGSGGVLLLANGNYLVFSPAWDNDGTQGAGAVTWGDGATGVSGVVSTTNSLVGSATDDWVGSAAALPNGNYVVLSPYWDNGTTADVGAVTWGDGTTGTTGVVSTTNSLVGSTADDRVGYWGTTALTNGNYVVLSPYWNNGTTADAGAATWGDGTTGTTGVVSTTNSLVGSTAGDKVGEYVTPLTNGNYVVGSPSWDNGTAADAGAVTWGDGSIGATGVVSTTNSLVGSTAGDAVGSSEDGPLVTALSNGNYVVASPYWNNGTTANVGAATWGDGTIGTTGVVSTTNSLVGTNTYDAVGEKGVTALANGNYVVASPGWDNATVQSAGAATWGDGTTGTIGVVSTTNSLVGGTAFDDIALGGVTPLANGNYVVASHYWHNGPTAYAGAATWGNGTTGTIGVVSSVNSLVGSTANDYVASEGVTPLSNGNYVVLSPVWNGVVTEGGAATWGNGTTGTSGPVSASNSLVGGTYSDHVGSQVTPLSNGNYVVLSPAWNNGTTPDNGAATWGDGTAGTTGPVSASNSLVGSTAYDHLGTYSGTAFANGHYVFHSPDWDNALITDAGAVTWVNGWVGASGAITGENSVRGATAYCGTNMFFDYDYTNDQLVVGRSLENIVTLFKPPAYEARLPLVLKRAS
jgi:hypothetical protein